MNNYYLYKKYKKKYKGLKNKGGTYALPSKSSGIPQHLNQQVAEQYLTNCSCRWDNTYNQCGVCNGRGRERYRRTLPNGQILISQRRCQTCNGTGRIVASYTNQNFYNVNGTCNDKRMELANEGKPNVRCQGI